MKYGIHSDGTRYYRTPMEPGQNDEVTIKIRVCEGVDAEVLLRMRTKWEEPQCVKMDKVATANGFDYYLSKVKVKEQTVRYYFEIKVGDETMFYTAGGLKDRHDDTFYDFAIYPGYKTPDWAKGAILYQIFTDRFADGNPDNNVYTGEYEYLDRPVRQRNWDDPIEVLDVNNFYGGDLQGVIDKLDYLKHLGVEGIYLNPIFVSPSNHKYDTQDYDHVDPHYGVIVEQDETKSYASRILSRKNLEASDKLFETLVKRAHEKGIRVILDGVFNHCGSFNKWMDSYHLYGNDTLTNPENPFREYFNFDENNNYEQWWGNDTLPKLNYENSPELVERIYGVARKWAQPPYNIDGWRLDVAADLGHSEQFNHEFWKGFRQEVKGVNPECLILAEHYGTPTAWLKNQEWDSVMNYDAFMEPITWFLTGMEKHSDEYREDLYNNADAFWGAMAHYSAMLPIQSLHCAMNQLSNHDHSRFLTRTNKTPGRLATAGSDAASEGIDIRVFMEAVVFQMTWRGAPTLYYGDEAGLCGFTDPDNRRPYPWGKENKTLIDFYRAAIKLRKRFGRLFTYGSVLELYRDYGLLVYARVTDDEVVIVCINNNDNGVSFELPIWKAGMPKDNIMYEEFQTGRGGFNRMYNVPHRVFKQCWSTRIGEKSTRVFRYKLDRPEYPV